MNDTPTPAPQPPQASPIYDPENDSARIRRVVAAMLAKQARNPQPPLPDRAYMRLRKRNARSRVLYKIKTGKLVRPPHCEQCKTPGPTEAHHLGVNKRSKVIFLCKACHRQAHA